MILEITDGVKNVNPIPVLRSMYNTAGVPYASTAEVISENVLALRYFGESFYIRTSPNTVEEYWFKDSINDVGLILKNAPSLDTTDWDTAFGWGDHALGGYLTGVPSSILSSAEVIPDARDLNTYTVPGFFYQDTDAKASTGTNYPIGKAGSLKVAEDSGIVQIYITDGSLAQEFRRHFYSGSWGSWIQIWSSLNFTESDVSKGTTAYGWGDHNTIDYLTESGPSTIKGDLTVGDNTVDSHRRIHIIPRGISKRADMLFGDPSNGTDKAYIGVSTDSLEKLEFGVGPNVLAWIDPNTRQFISNFYDLSTNIGATVDVSIDSATNTSSLWSALPVGYSSIMSSSIGTIGGLPVDGENGYFHKVANRDSSGGWAGIFIGHTSGKLFSGIADTSASFATWMPASGTTLPTFTVIGGTVNNIEIGSTLIVELTVGTVFTLPEISTLTDTSLIINIKNITGLNSDVQTVGGNTLEGNPSITLSDSDNITLYISGTDYKLL